jgi:hypothetical protein
MAAVDGERERQAAARVRVSARIKEHAHQAERAVRRGDAKRVRALGVRVGAPRRSSLACRTAARGALGRR